jgi:5-methylcytosine-specific restriction endonuclease McrA
MKRSGLKRRSKPPKQPDELERMADFKAAADAQGCCQVCGSRTALVAHHVVTRNHVEREGGDAWDTRNAIPLCSGPSGCHAAHHNRTRPIPLSVVPAETLEFANELLGAGPAGAYFERYYLPHTRWVGY